MERQYMAYQSWPDMPAADPIKALSVSLAGTDRSSAQEQAETAGHFPARGGQNAGYSCDQFTELGERLDEIGSLRRGILGGPRSQRRGVRFRFQEWVLSLAGEPNAAAAFAFV
jgi:hypothetical protein